jgi:nucleotide-binding universal stress UspA family protein
MRVLFHVGATLADDVLAWVRPIIQHAAQSLTLVSSGHAAAHGQLAAAHQLLQLPPDLPTDVLVVDGDEPTAIQAAVAQQPYDLVMLERLPASHHGTRGRQPSGGPRPAPSVLRIHGQLRPIRHVLLASGGDFHTFETASITARAVAPLGARATLMHVIPPEALVFAGFGARRISIEQFLSSTSVAAVTLRDAAATLERRGVATRIDGRAGPILEELLEELDTGQYDLLAIGAQRVESPLSRILYEDIAADLLELSPIPVLVAKGMPAIAAE